MAAGTSQAPPKARTRSTAGERQAQIVQAAVAAFAEGGYRATTTAEVARRVGVSQPYVIRLVGTKQALFLAAVELACDDIEAAFREAASTSTDRSVTGRIEAMGDAFMDMVLRRRELLLVLLHAFAAGGDPDVGPVVRRRFGRIVDLVPTLTGVDQTGSREFLSVGMLLMVLSAMEVVDPACQGTEPWSARLLGTLRHRHGADVPGPTEDPAR